MNRYECEYEGKVRQYSAPTAIKAIQKMVRLNHAELYLVGVDRETEGNQYARGWVYKGEKSNGEWVDMRIVKTMKEVA